MITDKKLAMKIRSMQVENIRLHLIENLRRAPHNCVHHEDHLIPNHGDETIGLCMYGAEDPTLWPGDLCDKDEIAQACPYFKCKHEKQELIKEQNDLYQNPDYVREHHPDMAALLWVLTEDPAWMTNSNHPNPYQMDLTWWQKIQLRWGI